MLWRHIGYKTSNHSGLPKQTGTQQFTVSLWDLGVKLQRETVQRNLRAIGGAQRCGLT